ncbi:hypothetical protein V2A60_006018 [Cordyceps javanica]
MGLLQLPIEVLIIIANLTLPYSVEDFSLTCSRLHDAAKTFLPRHNHLRSKYRSISFKEGGLEKVSDLLAEIAADPIIAAYIVHLDLGDRQFCGDGEIDDADGDDGLARFWLREIVRDVDYCFEGDQEAEFNIPFLVSLLTHVETLILPEEWCDFDVLILPDSKHPVAAMMQLLVTRANDRTLKDQPLQRLRAIYPAREIGEQFGTEMELIFPFMALDSLRELRLWRGHCQYEEEQNEATPFKPLGRNLEVIKLRDYVINGGSAGFLFEHIQNLRIFEMEYSTKDEIGYAFDADLFVRFLIKNTFASLERLVLTGVQVWPDTNVLDSSLRKFTRLKHLEISTVFLVNGIGAMGPKFVEEYFDTEEEESSDEGDSCDDEGSHEWDDEEGDKGYHEDDGEEEGIAKMYEGDDYEARDMSEAEDDHQVAGSEGYENDDAVDDEEHINSLDSLFHPDDKQKRYKSGSVVWRLVSVLPESLETLVIHTPAAPRNSACVERMFWQFQALRPERFPRLERIEVRVNQMDCWGRPLDGAAEQVARLRTFFAGKDILTGFEVVDVVRGTPVW